MIKKFQKDYCKDYELFFVLYFAWLYIVSPVAGVLRYFFNTHSIDVLVLDAFLLVLFINVLSTLAHRIKGWQIVSIFAMFVALVVSSLFSSDFKLHSTVWVNFITQCCPVFILAGCVRDFDKVYRYLLIIMRVYAYVGFISFRILGTGGIGDDATYSAEMTYQWLLPATVLLYDVIKSFSFRSFIPLLLSLFSVMGFGSRGPLVSVVLSLVLFLLTRKGSIKNKLKVIVTVVLLAGVIVANSERVLSSMIGIFEQTNMTSRSLMYLDKESLEEDARSALLRIGINRITENPLIGTGLVNDRLYIKNTLHSSEDAHGWYPHNFIIEILMQLGLFLGLLVLFLFFRFLIKGYKKSPTPDARSIVLIFIGAYLFPLLFSSSYLESIGFYALVGLIGAGIEIRNISSYMPS